MLKLLFPVELISQGLEFLLVAHPKFIDHFVVETVYLFLEGFNHCGFGSKHISELTSCHKLVLRFESIEELIGEDCLALVIGEHLEGLKVIQGFI